MRITTVMDVLREVALSIPLSQYISMLINDKVNEVLPVVWITIAVFKFVNKRCL